MAIVITDISTIFDFASAIAISSLAFLFPGSFYRIAEKKYASDKPRNNFNYNWSIAFTIIGSVNFCLGMYSSINNIIKGEGGEE